MNITKTTNDQGSMLFIEGRLDSVTFFQLERELLATIAYADTILLDLTYLEFISSAGLRVFLMGKKAAEARGAIMKLVNVPEVIMEILTIAGFNTILAIEG